MIVDIHQHITWRRFPEFAGGAHGPFNASQLVRDMDKWGIDRSVVLPLGNPENLDHFGVTGNQETIVECRRYADRLIPFCNVDPRAGLNYKHADLSRLLRIYRDLGCRGVGEVCAGLRITDPRCKNLFRHAGAVGLPVLFHLASRAGRTYGLVDRPGLPGLEEVLREFPHTVFIGHAPAFWNEIDGNLDPRRRNGYLQGPIRKHGALWRLMAAYANLFGDMSAGSGYKALTRDPAVGWRFLKRFHRKIFFGTDMFFVKKEPPMHLVMMRTALAAGHITRAVHDDIMYRNFQRVFYSRSGLAGGG